jgi:UDPglucose 6-dehydrogenase
MKKMNIGLIGLGKLGLPVALAIESKGHNVCGYDINSNVKSYIENRKIPYQEIFVDDLLKSTKLEFVEIRSVIEKSEIIFVPVQTPHDPMFEGCTRIPEERVDFNYDALISAMKQISEEVERIQEEKIVVIISTVLPGTIEKYIKPFLSNKIKLCYNPFFIAMGTTVRDFLNPEFVLLGVDDADAANKVEGFYATLHNKKVFRTSVKNAELIKVSYNTFIGMKIVFANTIMEICHKIGANVDDVIDAISLADERLISPKYLRGGMGDGGGCHPRDNIAMSWIAKTLDLSHDFFEDLMMAREHQTEWLSKLCIDTSLPIVILGKSFKPETNITTGSPSVLLYNILKEKTNLSILDPLVDGVETFEKELSSLGDDPKVYFIGTQHEYFKQIRFNNNSIVIDPFRYIERTETFTNNNIQLISIGK